MNRRCTGTGRHEPAGKPSPCRIMPRSRTGYSLRWVRGIRIINMGIWLKSKPAMYLHHALLSLLCHWKTHPFTLCTIRHLFLKPEERLKEPDSILSPVITWSLVSSVNGSASDCLHKWQCTTLQKTTYSLLIHNTSDSASNVAKSRVRGLNWTLRVPSIKI